MDDGKRQASDADGALEAAFTEAAEALTAVWGRPIEEHRCLTWSRPGGAVKLILWPVYGFVEMAASREGAQQPWFLTRPSDQFCEAHGDHPVVSVARARVQAEAWLLEPAVGSGAVPEPMKGGA